MSPCGFSLNWQQDALVPKSSLAHQHKNNSNNKNDSNVELIVGARGIRQGKKPKSADDYKRMASRLSRWNMIQIMEQIRSMAENANLAGAPLAHAAPHENSEMRKKKKTINDSNDNIDSSSNDDDRINNLNDSSNNKNMKVAPTTAISNNDSNRTYQELKRNYYSSVEWNLLHELMRHDCGGFGSTNPLAGWLTSREQGDFSLD